MDGVYNTVDDDINLVRIGGADIVAKLLVTAQSRQLCFMSSATYYTRCYTDKLGILKGKNRRFVERIRDSVGRSLARRSCVSFQHNNPKSIGSLRTDNSA